MHQNRRQRAPDAGERIIARHQIALRDPVECGRRRIQFAGEIIGQNLPPRRRLFFLKAPGPSRQAGPRPGQRRLALRIVQHAADLIHKVVAGGAIRAPCGRQFLAARENFLHYDVGRAFRRLRRPRRTRHLHHPPQFPRIAARVRQAVDMVDAYAVDQALSIEI